ncbi:N-acetyltransferase [Streptomyces sp. BH105]|uniref:N-acetyltransferase n=1 Tax=Streptomyces sp. BH105 TaxID=3410408 RepID=UPI003CE7FF4A
MTVDHAVFADLRGLIDTEGAEESRALEAGWMTDLVELAYTPQLVHQVRDVSDASERHHQRAALSGLQQLSPAESAVARHSDEVLRAATTAIEGLQIDHALKRSVRYIAETSCAGHQVLATRDPVLLRLADIAWEAARVRIVTPATVTLHVDELRQAQLYRPADLLGTEFRSSEVTPGGEGELVAFFDQSGHDAGSTFADRLRSLASDGVAWRRQLLRDGAGNPVALYAWALDGRTLAVPVLRTSAHPLEETLARQLLFLLKRLARDCGAESVCITDPHPSAAASSAAGDDGFFEREGTLTALVVDVCGTAEEVEAAAGGLARNPAVKGTVLHAGMPAEVAAVVERAWWPAKIIDSALLSFLVPIKPRWSTDLFNVPAMLVPRSETLGISREHVYYRTSGHRGERVPARLLWYVSEGDTGVGGKMIVASSRLDEVIIDTPEALFSKFEHLGVYGRSEVVKTADNTGRAMALRFSDTEIFPRAVTLQRLTSLAQGLGLPWSSNSLISLSRISSELFQAVYQEGHRTT